MIELRSLRGAKRSIGVVIDDFSAIRCVIVILSKRKCVYLCIEVSECTFTFARSASPLGEIHDDARLIILYIVIQLRCLDVAP